MGGICRMKGVRNRLGSEQERGSARSVRKSRSKPALQCVIRDWHLGLLSFALSHLVAEGKQFMNCQLTGGDSGA